MRQHAMQALHAGTVIPAMPLVLDASRHWDEVGQRRIIRYYLAAGVGGLAVAVHTTQFAIRKPGIDLFEPVLRLAMEEIAAYEERTGRVIVRIAGVCGPTPQAQREVRLAASLGYDAVLLSPGGLGAQEEAYLLERTREVAVFLPVIGFYLQPAVGGRVFTYDYWQALCQIDDVVAIKCAGFDRYLMMDVARAICYRPRAEKIAFYTGNDDNIVIDLLTPYVFDDTHKIRVVGGLLGHWAVWTHTAVRMLERIRATGEEMPRALLT
ncbi:MAG: dihydrodipicolinate synthase family protein, partial [Clostridia bacterium]